MEWDHMTLQTVYSFQVNDLHTGKRNFEAIHQQHQTSNSGRGVSSTTNIVDVQQRSGKRLCIASNGYYQQPIINYNITSGNKRLKETIYSSNDHGNADQSYKKSRHCYNYNGKRCATTQESMVISDDESEIKARKIQGNDDVWNHIGIG